MIHSKLPKLGTTIFTVMSRMAAEYGAVNLSQGFPDFETHPRLIELVSKHMQAGHNQYAPSAGLLSLREGISQKVETAYGHAPQPETEITITSGASEALFNIFAALVRPGDEIIIFEPAFDLYQPVIELFGGKVVSVPLQTHDYAIDWELAQKAISPQTKAVLINSPHNPSGAMLSASDMKQLATLTKKHKLLLISDEVYEHITFDNLVHESVLKYPELRERSFAVPSILKTFSLRTGVSPL